MQARPVVPNLSPAASLKFQERRCSEMSTGRVPCDGNSDWVYNLHNRKILHGDLRLDRCSSLVSHKCDDLGEHLHERHCLPEGYLLAESTPHFPTGHGKVDRLLWADSESGDSTLIAVQNLSGVGKTRHSMYWSPNTLEFGERAYRPTSTEKIIMSEKTAEYLISCPRYAHTRILKADIKHLMLEWLDKETSYSCGDFSCRKILRTAANILADKSVYSFASDKAREKAVELFEASLNDPTKKVHTRIREAIKYTDTLTKPETLTAEYAIAKEVETNWSRYGTTQYRKRN